MKGNDLFNCELVPSRYSEPASSGSHCHTCDIGACIGDGLTAVSHRAGHGWVSLFALISHSESAHSLSHPGGSLSQK